MKTRYITAIAAATLMLAGCQRDELAGTEALSGKDGIVKFAPSIGGIVTGVKSSVSETVPAATRTQSLTLTSEDGTYTLPMSLSVTSMEAGTATKAALINDPGTETGPVLPLGNFATSIDNTFWVTAWDATPSRIIPDAPTGTALTGYVSGSATNGWYQKVAYRDAAGGGKYWMTIQKQTATVTGAPGDADDEYIWKKINAERAETKTFFAYANLASGASISNTTSTSQTLTLESLPDKDILLGCYSGEGKTGTGDDAKHTGTASIRFYHPMTAVKFKKGTLPDGTSIQSISIEGVYPSGKTIQTSTTETGFVWTKTDGNAFTADDESLTVSLGSVDVDGTTSQIGDAIILIPQTFTSNSKTRIKVVLNDGSSDIPLYYLLTSGSWAAGHTYVLTIGYEIYEYSFELTDPGQATQTFSNSTTDSAPVTIAVTSTKTDASGETAEDWRIRSYRIGSGAPVDVRSTSFTGGGLEVSKSSTNLKITAQPRTLTYGSHDYWVNSMKRTDRLDWSPAAWPGVTDLSKLDYKTEIRNAHSMTTANCYIIRHAGTYKFPLVYGNAVQDGIENRDAYAPTMADGGSNFLSLFHSHLGNGITSAFIENNTDCTAATCEVLWQDEAAVIGTPEIVGATVTVGDYDASNVRYIQFTVNETTICQNNALIAVKDGDGNTIWSWHIWTTNDPALLDDPITVTNHTSHEYDFFPLYCLGWIDASYQERETVVITLEQTYSGETVEVTVNQPAVVTASHGTYYQFGRKDPMCTVNTPAGGGTFTPNGGNNGGAGVSLATAICNPNVFYTVIKDSGSDANLNWCDNTYYNLWTGKKSKTGKFDQDDEMIKTIYDPSPVGYKLPASNAFTGFTTTGNNEGSKEYLNIDGKFDNGWNFFTKPGKEGATVFFAITGRRGAGNGEIAFNQGGLYWTAVPCSVDGSKDYFGYYLSLDENGVGPAGAGTDADGLVVRPVLER